MTSLTGCCAQWAQLETQVLVGLENTRVLGPLPGVSPRSDVGHHLPAPDVLHLVAAEGDESLGVPVHGEADLLVKPVEDEDDPSLGGEGPRPDLPGVREEVTGVGRGEASIALVGAAVLHTPRLQSKGLIVA